MRNYLLIVGFFCLISSNPNTLFAASSQKMPAETAASLDKTFSERKSEKQLKKASRWQKRLQKFEKKLQKKMERRRSKGKVGDNFSLGFIGLIVMLIGGLFIVLGLVIPAIGILFLVIGIIIAFVGLLLLLLLGGVSVDVS